MNIQEAVKEALEKDCCITILDKNGEFDFKIKPKKIIVGGFCKAKAYREMDTLYFETWIPNYLDLISDKWALVDNDLKELEEKQKKKWWFKERS